MGYIPYKENTFTVPEWPQWAYRSDGKGKIVCNENEKSEWLGIFAAIIDEDPENPTDMKEIPQAPESVSKRRGRPPKE
jgi:hypothetical protein